MEKELDYILTKNKELYKRLAGGIMIDKTHGSPYDRGSADRYYGRPRSPHKIVHEGPTNTFGFQQLKTITDLTEDEIAEYNAGYEEETDRKNWRDE